MNNSTGILALALAVGICTGMDPARAALPADRVVSYSIRLDPEYESSVVVFDIALEISAVSEQSGDVQWSIKAADFTERDQTGAYVRSWRVEDPVVDTPDGYWWVYHDDSLVPQVAEFTEPPGMEGIATAQEQGQADLRYSLAPATVEPAHRSMFGGNVAAITYAFIDWETELGIAAGEDEPTEVDLPPIEPPVG